MVIIVNIKMYRSNFFSVVSNSLGRVLLIKNAGNLGFKNIEKRNFNAFNKVFSVVLKYLLSVKNNYIFFKLEGVKQEIIRDVYKQSIILIKKYNMFILGFKIVNKISHNGCRKK